MQKEHTVLYVFNDPSRFMLHWRYRALRAVDAGFRVFVASPGAPTGSNGPFQWLDYPLNRRGTNPILETRSVVALSRLISRIHPDLLHTMTVKPNLYVGLAASLVHVPPRVMSIPGLGYVFTATDRSVSLTRRLILFLYRRVARSERVRLLFENEDDRAFFLSQGIGSDDRCIRVSGAGVDLDRFSPRPEPTGIPVVVLPTRMLWDKGVAEFVGAARLLSESGVQARFVLVGDSDPGNPAAVPREQLLDWHDSGLVEWWGFQEDMASILCRSNVVCLPSYREGAPRALMEAASSGRAVVATDAPGCRDVVCHGENGLLVPVRDVDALASALRRLIEDPRLRETMGARGREIAVAQFAQERAAAEMLAVYRQLLG